MSLLKMYPISTTARLNESRGSEEYQVVNSSIAWPYESCEVTAPSEFMTPLLECSRSRRRRMVFGRFSFLLVWCVSFRVSHTGGQVGAEQTVIGGLVC